MSKEVGSPELGMITKSQENLMLALREVLIKYLISELALQPEDLEPNAALISNGAIDSFSLVSLITFIEEQTKIQIDAADVTLENFDSLERILSFVSKSKSESTDSSSQT